MNFRIVRKFLEFMKINSLLISIPGLKYTVKRSKLWKLIVYETPKSSIYKTNFQDYSIYLSIILYFIMQQKSEKVCGPGISVWTIVCAHPLLLRNGHRHLSTQKDKKGYKPLISQAVAGIIRHKKLSFSLFLVLTRSTTGWQSSLFG